MVNLEAIVELPGRLHWHLVRVDPGQWTEVARASMNCKRVQISLFHELFLEEAHMCHSGYGSIARNIVRPVVLTICDEISPMMIRPLKTLSTLRQGGLAMWLSVSATSSELLRRGTWGLTATKTARAAWQELESNQKYPRNWHKSQVSGWNISL